MSFYNKKAVMYGGHGVQITLNYFLNTNRVFWSSRGNSFVMVGVEKPEHYSFITPTGLHVKLLSINGIGEIRWTCDPRDLKYTGGDADETHEAVEYFKLKPSIK